MLVLYHGTFYLRRSARAQMRYPEEATSGFEPSESARASGLNFRKDTLAKQWESKVNVGKGVSAQGAHKSVRPTHVTPRTINLRGGASTCCPRCPTPLRRDSTPGGAGSEEQKSRSAEEPEQQNPGV